jgi:hypothetical protein
MDIVRERETEADIYKREDCENITKERAMQNDEKKETITRQA